MGSKKVAKKKVVKPKVEKTSSLVVIDKILALEAELERVKCVVKRALTEGPAAIAEL